MFWSTITNGKMCGRSMSAAVTTATTPGRVRASSTSMATTRPWATVDRTYTTCRAPGEGTSST